MIEEVKHQSSIVRPKDKEVKCLDCDNVFLQKPVSGNRLSKIYCSTVCYRSYMAKRFERWANNPQEFKMPESYDEFLNKDELSCLIKGCNWTGLFLSIHMNASHGVTATEFKKITGFNLGSGIMAKGLAKRMSERPKVGVALTSVVGMKPTFNSKGLKKHKSAESKEHEAKARIMARGTPPVKICVSCGTIFQQKTVYGATLYCTKRCRQNHYNELNKAKNPNPGKVRDDKGVFRRYGYSENDQN